MHHGSLKIRLPLLQVPLQQSQGFSVCGPFLQKRDGCNQTTSAISLHLHFRISEVLRRVLQLVMGRVTALEESADMVVQAAYAAQCQHSAMQRSIDEASWHARHDGYLGPQQVGGPSDI